jgi:glycine/D-amino acid oxidase-like deaminating enzyme
MARVVVVGAGIVGAACAWALSGDGHRVTVLDRGPVGAGTTSRGEGNILVSDKEPGPELALALWSARLWRELGADLGADDLELEAKGGLVVAADAASMDGLSSLAERQAAAGVRVESVAAQELSDYEPHLAGGLVGGAFYPGDQQVQPVRAAAAMLRGARRRGAEFRSGIEVTGLRAGAGGAVVEVLTDRGAIPTDLVVNAAGTWGGTLSARFGAPVPVLPRRGFILVTEPLPGVVRHKVYSADYTATVASGDAGRQTSVVVEGTRGGTVLIGASRERVGFDGTVDYDVVRILAGQAVHLFPVLADISLLRVYRGFRPYCPDHLPVIGPDPRVTGLFHACGHEGAGIGLAPATGALLAALVAGRDPEVDPAAFRPGRFAAGPGTAPADATPPVAARPHGRTA